MGDALGMVEGRVKGDLERFKEFIEERQGQPTGAWDGEIENRDAPGGHTAGMGALHDTGAGDQQADRDLGER